MTDLHEPIPIDGLFRRAAHAAGPGSVGTPFMGDLALATRTPAKTGGAR